jgi:excinuclease ABC subunit C
MDDLPGVGKARRKLLLDYFQSFDKLKTASLDEIKEVKGISAKVAESIFLYLRSSN